MPAGRRVLTARPGGPTFGSCELGSQLVHYVIVRGDLPTGLKVANAVHAAGESSDRVPAGTIAVALQAQDADHLDALAEELDELDISHAVVVEGEGDFAGQPMAIGLEPLDDRARARRVLSSLPLIR